jgi:hypothetical protein
MRRGALAAIRALAIVMATALLSIAFATTAVAQSRVRVTAERATVWRPGFLTPAAIVNRDTILDVVGRSGNWLEVVVPGGDPEVRLTGFIAIAQVTPVSGSVPLDREPPAGPRPSRPVLRRPTGTRTSGARGFFDVDYTAFLARHTFDAVFDRPTGVFVGGGADVRWHDAVFVQGSVRWLHETGERAAVSNGEVFKLGLTDELTLVPMAITVGGRFPAAHTVPYAGVGIGSYHLRETSQFADPDENTDRWFPSYHAVVGLEARTGEVVTVAGEVGFEHVPRALGGGIADAFGEHNLGGVHVRVRILIGKS